MDKAEESALAFTGGEKGTAYAFYVVGYRQAEKDLKDELEGWLNIMIDLCESGRLRTERETFEQVKDKLNNM